ncbi:transmembrane protein 241 isoform X2 [Oryzias melastigma]|uniref:transmembrane protein 241 isoform X2 n=1 Tax=Oryzias melastigma TaxID=30732 RepID=UPI000CF81CF5|nr:transmembrane protein 241 isoform X2 [Oryzias melastigma]
MPWLRCILPRNSTPNSRSLSSVNTEVRLVPRDKLLSQHQSSREFVLSVLNFTYPTLFQGWQTFIGAVLLLLSGKLGWVEMSFISRSAALSWLPASLLFVGNIYAGSRALSRLDIPFFFTLQNSSHVVTYIISTALHREKQKMHQLKSISMGLMLLAAVNLPLCDPQVDYSAYLWAVCHLLCAGAYKAFQVHKSSSLSDCEQHWINCLFSVLLLALAAHPTGDLTGALEFPSLHSGVFHCGCSASALLGFLLLLVTVKLKRGLSSEHLGIWIFISKRERQRPVFCVRAHQSGWRGPAGVFRQRFSGGMIPHSALLTK